MQSKYVFPDQLDLTTPVEVTLHDAAGRETVVSGFVSARYLERPDIYDVTLPNEHNQHGETKVLRNVSVGRLKIIGEPVAERILLTSYQSAPIGA
jgi:hypothetical protein